jgi:hypothetical protein
VRGVGGEFDGLLPLRPELVPAEDDTEEDDSESAGAPNSWYAGGPVVYDLIESLVTRYRPPKNGEAVLCSSSKVLSINF